VSGRVLTAEQLAQYAREQIRTADDLLARHRPAGGSSCRCDRPLPCTHAETLRVRRAHYLTQLGLSEPTQVLPAVASSPRPRRLRALMSRLIRGARRGDV